MSEEQQAPQSQADDGGQAQEATQNEEVDVSQEETEERVPKSELTKRNKEAQQLRRERNDLKQRLDAYESEKLSEQEKRDKRIADLEEELNGRDSRIAELESRARRSTFIESINLADPRLAYASLGEIDVQPEYDESGRITNLEKVRKALKAEFPRQFGNGSADGGERQEPAQATSMNEILRASRGRVIR